jgi:phosphoribosylanthranilate isomerase
MSETDGSRVRVKICGITTVADGLAAVHAGADAVGLVFWPRSPRFVGRDLARTIARALPPFVLRVGVFVDAPRDELARTADEVGLDLLQLHGSEPAEAFQGLPRRALKAVRVGDGFDPAEALRFAGRADGVLLDTKWYGLPGGTGRAFDWSAVRPVREAVSFLVLAGGLTPANVRAAVEAVGPDAVDVSSGVESSPGRKDPEKMRTFVAAVKG